MINSTSSSWRYHFDDAPEVTIDAVHNERVAIRVGDALHCLLRVDGQHRAVALNRADEQLVGVGVGAQLEPPLVVRGHNALLQQRERVVS